MPNFGRPLLITPMIIGIGFGTLSYANSLVINHQGVLLDSGGNPLSGNYNITFSIWDDPSIGIKIWEETQSVDVTDGLYEVHLGEIVQLDAGDLICDPPISSLCPRYLQIQVDADPPMAPRTALVAVPFSGVARSVQGDGIRLDVDEDGDNDAVLDVSGVNLNMPLIIDFDEDGNDDMWLQPGNFGFDADDDGVVDFEVASDFQPFQVRIEATDQHFIASRDVLLNAIFEVTDEFTKHSQPVVIDSDADGDGDAQITTSGSTTNWEFSGVESITSDADEDGNAEFKIAAGDLTLDTDDDGDPDHVLSGGSVTFSGELGFDPDGDGAFVMYVDNQSFQYDSDGDGDGEVVFNPSAGIRFDGVLGISSDFEEDGNNDFLFQSGRFQWDIDNDGAYDFALSDERGITYHPATDTIFINIDTLGSTGSLHLVVSDDVVIDANNCTIASDNVFTVQAAAGVKVDNTIDFQWDFDDDGNDDCRFQSGQYEWDVDDDGTSDLTLANSGYRFYRTCDFTPGVHVIDVGGDTLKAKSDSIEATGDLTISGGTVTLNADNDFGVSSAGAVEFNASSNLTVSSSDTILFSSTTIENDGNMHLVGNTQNDGDLMVGQNLDVQGNLNVAGTKNFVQDHPHDAGKIIVYTALEGNEAGTYTRGSAQLVDGMAEVILPKSFALVTAVDGLTAQITPRSPVQSMLYVEEVTPSRLTVKASTPADADVAFDFLVNGVRAGFEDHQVIQEREQYSNR